MTYIFLFYNRVAYPGDHDFQFLHFLYIFRNNFVINIYKNPEKTSANYLWT